MPANLAPVSPRSSLTFVVALGLLSACGSEPHEAAPSDGAAVQPGRAPEPAPAPEPKPAPELTPEPKPEPDPDPDPEGDPALAEAKRALADVGRKAFEALQAGDFEGLTALTPGVEGYLAEVCPDLPKTPGAEVEARFDHCHDTIAWNEVTEAQVFAGKPTGAPAQGCEAGIEDYGRLQLFLHMQDATIWRVDFYGAVGRDGNPIGINGEVACRKVDEAPKLR